MGAPDARVQLTGGRLDAEWPAMVAWAGLVARCRLRDGTVHEAAGWVPAAGSLERFRARCGPLDVDLAMQPADGCVRMQAEVNSTAAADVTEVAIAGRVSSARSSLGWVLCNGYQSWDAAGLWPAGAIARESWWTVGLADDRGDGLAAAATASTSSCTRFAVAGGTFEVAWREAEMLEPWPVLFGGPAGTRWRSDPVLLSAGPGVRARLASLLCPTRRPAPAEIGWSSWYHYGPWVRSEDVMANAELLIGDGWRRLGYRVVLLDDGWQQAYGEWRPNTKFSGGLAALTQDLAARGLLTGLWLAPFLVSVAADLAVEAPDAWFVMDPATGERAVDHRHRVFGPMHVLDASHPGVRAHLRGVFSGLRAEGIRRFKIDFLYAGAYAGLRALRAGIEAIREGVPDALLIASGAPLLPVAGLVDACRVGPDTATPVHDFETGVSAPNVFGDEVLAVARNAAARAPLQRWYRLDADAALTGGNLSLEQGRQLVTVAALSGGPFFASDDLAGLPPERLDLLTNPEVLDLVGGGAAAPDWDPNAGDLPATHWRRGDVLAVFNWTTEPAEVAVRAPGASGARDLWARRELETFADDALLAVPAHGVRLLRLR